MHSTTAETYSNECRIMPTLTIHFNERDTLPELLEKRAGELDITVEQLVKRFISEGIRDQMDNGPLIPGESLDDFFVKNGVLISE